jgi:hypothetical protein
VQWQLARHLHARRARQRAARNLRRHPLQRRDDVVSRDLLERRRLRRR